MPRLITWTVTLKRKFWIVYDHNGKEVASHPNRDISEDETYTYASQRGLLVTIVKSEN